MDFYRFVLLYKSLWDQVMSSSKAMVSANQGLHTRYDTMTAIFTGATRGIGLGTLEAFVKHIPKPKAIIVGRSRGDFAVELEVLQKLNPAAELVFIEAQLSLIEDIDRVCGAIKQKSLEHSVDMLCMSQGYAPIGERKFTTEGLDEAMTLACYGRVRLAERLISSGVMATDARVVSVLAGGKEDNLFENDMELKANYSITNLRGHFASVMTLAFDKFAKQTSGMGFVHVYPGTVSTGIWTRGIDSNSSSLLRYALVALEFLIGFVAMTPQQSGERTLWMATTDNFADGSFALNYDGGLSQSTQLQEYRQHPQTADMVWEHLQALFERAASSKTSAGH